MAQFYIESSRKGHCHAKVCSFGDDRHHKRRIYTKEKLKVVAAVWGQNLFILFLATLAVVD